MIGPVRNSKSLVERQEGKLTQCETKNEKRQREFLLKRIVKKETRTKKTKTVQLNKEQRKRKEEKDTKYFHLEHAGTIKQDRRWTDLNNSMTNEQVCVKIFDINKKQEIDEPGGGGGRSSSSIENAFDSPIVQS